ncbi:MAG: T9SS type A sorting domain-containing protein [Ferruginibacter sp.]
MKNYTKTLLLFLLVCSFNAFSLPKLNSFSSAIATIFIDFDGHTVTSSGWNGGTRLQCLPAPLTELQMTEIFNRVSEDYRPFDINITTDSTKFLSAPLNRRIRIIVTPTSSWSPGVGGVAYIGSFTWGDDTPAFVFTDRLLNSPKYIGECVSHESGHTVGLAHQSTYNTSCGLVEQYATGSGAGETSWAPIMGNSYYKNMTGWNLGPTPYGCSNLQDNLTIISSQNGFGYRPDDYTEILDATTTTPINSHFSLNGIIANSSDKDAFVYIITQTSPLHIEATPFRLNTGNAGANLDVAVDVYNSANILIRSYSPEDRMNVVIDTTLDAGTYYFVISGSGNLNTVGYGSIGSYTFTGFSGALPIRDVTLSGKDELNKHSFNWNIIADEPVKYQVIEMSVNGTEFKELSQLTASIKQFEYSPQQNGTLFYRLKVTSVIDQVAYSNTIALKATGKENKFIISTLIQNDITVNGTGSYAYMVADANGRIIKKGTGTSGINRIDMNAYSAGMYILQVINQNTKQTERIIKQ